MINDTSDSVNPLTFAENAAAISKKSGLKCTVLNREKSEAKKWGFFSQ